MLPTAHGKIELMLWGDLFLRNLTNGGQVALRDKTHVLYAAQSLPMIAQHVFRGLRNGKEDQCQ